MKKVITLICVLIMLISITSVTGATSPEWLTRANMPTARYILGATVLNNKIYAISGYPGLQTVEEYDPIANTWSAKADMAYGREYVQPVVLNGEIYAISCGNESIETATVEAYDPASNTWEFKARCKFTLLWSRYCRNERKDLQDRWLCLCNGLYISNAVEEYDPDTNQLGLQSEYAYRQMDAGYCDF